MSAHRMDTETSYRRLLGGILLQACKDAKRGDNDAVAFLTESSELFELLDLNHAKAISWIADGMPGKRIHRIDGKKRSRRAKRQPIRPVAEIEPMQLSFAMGD